MEDEVDSAVVTMVEVLIQYLQSLQMTGYKDQTRNKPCLGARLVYFLGVPAGDQPGMDFQPMLTY